MRCRREPRLRHATCCHYARDDIYAYELPPRRRLFATRAVECRQMLPRRRLLSLDMAAAAR